MSIGPRHLGRGLAAIGQRHAFHTRLQQHLNRRGMAKLGGVMQRGVAIEWSLKVGDLCEIGMRCALCRG